MTVAHPHLPADIAPGPQSRRLRMGRRAFGCAVPFLVAGGVLFAGGFTGAAYLVSALPGDDSPLPFAAGAAGGLAVFWILAVVFWRRAHPRRTRGLTATVDHQRVRRGGDVRARLSAGDESAELGLVCRVHYDLGAARVGRRART